MIRMAAVLALIATQVGAQERCGPYAEITGELEKAGYERVSYGQLPAVRMETWAEKRGNFLVFTVYPGDVHACLITGGEGYTRIILKPNL